MPLFHNVADTVAELFANSLVAEEDTIGIDIEEETNAIRAFQPPQQTFKEIL